MIVYLSNTRAMAAISNRELYEMEKTIAQLQQLVNGDRDVSVIKGNNAEE